MEDKLKIYVENKLKKKIKKNLEGEGVSTFLTGTGCQEYKQKWGSKVFLDSEISK